MDPIAALQGDMSFWSLEEAIESKKEIPRKTAGFFFYLCRLYRKNAPMRSGISKANAHQ